jgi:hypothetical protein
MSKDWRERLLKLSIQSLKVADAMSGPRSPFDAALAERDAQIDTLAAEIEAAVAVAETRLAWVDWFAGPSLDELDDVGVDLGGRLEREAETALAAYRRLKEHV